MGRKDPNPRPVLLPDEGAMVDEHGRPPGAPSRTGPGAGPPADPDRVDRARAEGGHDAAAGEDADRTPESDRPRKAGRDDEQ
ncbi:hypothetical protein ABZZ17_13045 [Streptomyces sp. NPDC006512]|uniref:hypothetical protein n=1 Tax=Streptomyces sp. NPDC006512 TaxID=3154307 RepID=UPI0033B67222